MPVGDASEACLGILALMMRHGVMVVDHDTGEPAGNLEPFVRSGLLGRDIVLMMQALGCGDLSFNGMDGLSALGANARDGVTGLGFRCIEDERWVTPNPVGLECVFEALCPPTYPDRAIAAVSSTSSRLRATAATAAPAAARSP
jgi:hypothetical protein